MFAAPKPKNYFYSLNGMTCLLFGFDVVEPRSVRQKALKNVKQYLVNKTNIYQFK